MKNLKTVIAALAISLVSTFSAFAVETEPKTTNQEIREKIVALLGSKVDMELTKDTSVEISFMVNNNNEMVVVSVDSSENTIDSFVKNKLNYKNLSVKGVKKGEIYRVPLTLKKA